MNRIYLDFLSLSMSFKITPQKIISFLKQKGESQKRNTEFSTPETVRCAAMQLPIQEYESLSHYLDTMYTQTAQAVEKGAQVVVFPEYVGLLAGTLIPNYRKLILWILSSENSSNFKQLAFNKERLNILAEIFHNFLFETYMATFSTLARLMHIYIVAGTCLFWEHGKLINRCIVFDPDGNTAGTQDKVCSVELDYALQCVPSNEMEPIDTPMGKLGVVIGSDSYYFECFKLLKEKGCNLIAVPASRTGILPDLLRCRSEEHKLYTIFSSYRLNDTPSGGVFSPFLSSPDENGILAQASEQIPEVICARTNLTKLTVSHLDGWSNPVFLLKDYLHSYRYCPDTTFFSSVSNSDTEEKKDNV